MRMKRFTPLLVVLTVSVIFVQSQTAQVAREPQTLESGKPVESDIAGGESHNNRAAFTLQGEWR